MERINRIKEILVIQNKTQVWLAEQMDRNVHSVSAYCSNRRQPTLVDLKRIAEILDVDITELLVRTKV